MDNDFDNVTWDTSDPVFPDSRPSTSTSASASVSYEYPQSPPSSRIPVRHEIDVGNAIGDTLTCTVNTPIKEQDGTKEAFVSYLVTTKSDFPSFLKPFFSVRRRFTDFLYLYKALVKEFIATAVPPIPDKARMEYVRGDRFGPEFTARRAASLERFLVRISQHPQLRRAKILYTFLESPDWNTTMRLRNQRNSVSSENGAVLVGGGAAGVFDAFADSVINVFTKVHKPDPRFLEIRDATDKLDEDLTAIEKVLVRVVRRLADLETDQNDLAEQFRKLIAMEPGVEMEVRGFAATLEDVAKDLHAMRESTDVDYLGSVRDMATYCGALKGLLKVREQKQLDYEQLTEYLAKSSVEKEALTHGGSAAMVSGPAAYAFGLTEAIRAKIEDVRGVPHDAVAREREKMRKLEMRIDMLGTEAESAKGTAELFNEEVLREVKDFEKIKRREFKGQLLGLCDANLKYYDGVVDKWERFMRENEGRA